jgi:hypothetical protein
MHIRAAVAALALAALAGTPAVADGTLRPLDRPEPATVAVPDLTFTPKSSDVRSYDDYFYFYKPGVTYEAAFADIDTCRMYGESARLVATPPKFVPLGADAVRRPNAMANGVGLQYGVIGLLIAGLIIEAAEEDATSATSRRCLHYKGYVRYGTRWDIAKKISAGTDVERVARMARIASGAVPQTEALEP